MISPSLKKIRMKVDALEKEVRLLRPILEGIRDPFFILNRKGEFLKANPKGVELLNYSPEELQQMVFIDVVALEDEWERSKKQFLDKIRERDQYARELQAKRAGLNRIEG